MKLFNFKFLRQNWPTVSFLFLVLIFFWQFFLLGKHPIPADTIVGMYHPWRDVIWDSFTNGVPYKNFLITDSVRQQYVWRSLAIKTLKNGRLPRWNPYSFSGTPLMANFQSATFYPLNILFFILPFNLSWSILVILQPLLGTIFTYLFLRNLKVSKAAALLGGLVFAFSGFNIAWMEWNTIGHTVLWLPLVLLSIDKIIYYSLPAVKSVVNSKLKTQNSKPNLKTKNLIAWGVVFIGSLSSSLFAGHLQIHFYVLIFSLFYLGFRMGFYRTYRIDKTYKTNIAKLIVLFVSCFLLYFLTTAVQWLPTLGFILHSARNVNPDAWMRPDWFLPWQHLVQFIAPDFFGNPATMNYWGVWNYGEFVGYIGILPLIFALFALFFRRDKKTLFFSSMTFIVLLFTLPTPIAKIPFMLKIPFISTSQPSRLLGIIDFYLAVLAAFGLDYFIFIKLRPTGNLFPRATSEEPRSLPHHRPRSHTVAPRMWPKGLLRGGWQLTPFVLIATVMSILWLLVLYYIGQGGEEVTKWAVARRNLILSTTLLAISIVVLLFPYPQIVRRKQWGSRLFVFAVISITIFDLFRFGWKFTPFVKRSFIFPETQITNFLQRQQQPFRIMTADREIFPPNFSIAYGIQTVEGYDPLYLERYGEYIGMWIRGKPDLSPSDFNRIISPQNYQSRFADLANVKYVLSLKDENSIKLKLVFQEGNTRVYENTEVFPRAYLVENVRIADSKENAAALLFESDDELKLTAVVEDKIEDIQYLPLENNESVEILSYEENDILLRSRTNTQRFMVLSDVYYPTWEAFVDNNPVKIYRTNYVFRGIIVPVGKHQIHFLIRSLF